jgi:hypothetical protein
MSHSHIEAGRREVQVGHVHHPERQPIPPGLSAHLCVQDGPPDEVNPGDVCAGLVGDVCRNPTVAAAQIEHTAARRDPADLDQVVDVSQVGEPVLAQVAAIDAHTVLGVGRTGRDGLIEAGVEVEHDLL